MLKIARFLARQPETGVNEFQDRCRARGQAQAQALRDAGVLRYVQNHARAPDLTKALREGRNLSAPPEVIEEFVVQDGAARAALNVLADGRGEAGHVDFASSSAFVGREHLMFDLGRTERPSGEANRLLFCLVPKQGMTHDDFHGYWLHHHAAVVMPHQPGALGIRRYTQLHRYETGEDMGLERFGSGQRYSGIASGWWPSFDDLQKAIHSEAAAQAMGALIDDEINFIDIPAMSGIFAKEETIFD